MEAHLSPDNRHLIVVGAGMRKREPDTITAQLAAVPENEKRVRKPVSPGLPGDTARTDGVSCVGRVIHLRSPVECK